MSLMGENVSIKTSSVLKEVSVGTHTRILVFLKEYSELSPLIAPVFSCVSILFTMLAH